MKSHCLIYLSFTVLLLGSIGGVSAEDWAMFRHDPEHHAFTNDSAPAEGELIWAHNVTETGWGVISSPAVVDGIVYFGSDDGNVTALDAANGKTIWEVNVNEWGVRSSPAIDKEKGLLFINSQAVYALYLSNGSEAWTFLTDEDWEFSSPLVYDDVVYIGSYDGKLYALNETTGQLLWSYDTHTAPRSPNFNGGNGGIGSSPATDGIRIFFGCTDNVFYAISMATHDIDWKYELGDRIQVGPLDYPFGNGADSISSPAVDLTAGDHGIVYIGADDGFMYAFDLEADDDGWDNDLDGVTDNEAVLIWQHEAGGQIKSSPAVHGDKVFFGSFESNIENFFALNKESGSEEWVYMFDDRVWSSPAVADGMVFTGSEDHYVTAFNESDGTLIWSYKTDSYVPSCPAVYNEIVYIGSTDHHLYALGIPGDRPDAAVGPGDLELPVNATENETIDIYCTVHNIGTANITSVDMDLTVNGENIYSDTVSIEVGKTFEFNVTWEAVKGNHTVNLTVSNCLPSEKNMDNNKVSKVIEVFEEGQGPQGPGDEWTFVDFSLQDLKISPQEPAEGEDIFVTAEVKNLGNGTGYGSITIYLDSEDEEGRIFTENFTLLEFRKKEFNTFFTGESGDHSVIAVTGCENDTESSNNRYTIDFTVSEGYTEPMPDLAIDNIVIMKEGEQAVDVYEEDFLMIQVTISNQGDRDTMVDLKLYDGDPTLNRIIGVRSITIQFGKTRTLVVNWVPTQGSHTLNAVVSSRTQEDNLDNNEKSISIYVGPKEKDDDDDDFIPISSTMILAAIGISTVIFWKKSEAPRSKLRGI